MKANPVELADLRGGRQRREYVRVQLVDVHVDIGELVAARVVVVVVDAAVLFLAATVGVGELLAAAVLVERVQHGEYLRLHDADRGELQLVRAPLVLDRYRAPLDAQLGLLELGAHMLACARRHARRRVVVRVQETRGCARQQVERRAVVGTVGLGAFAFVFCCCCCCRRNIYFTIFETDFDFKFAWIFLIY